MSSAKPASLTLLIALAAILGSRAVNAETVAGKVMGPDGRPVAGAVVVCLESGEVSETSDSGEFTLDVPPPPFTLRVESDGGERLDARFESAPRSPILLTQKPETVEMETVEVIAERTEIRTSRTVDAEAVRTVNTGNNPFALVEKAPEVVSAALPALMDDYASVQSEMTSALGLPILALQNAFSWRGLPAYSNAYFAGSGIPLFFQYYSLMDQLTVGIFPQELLSGVRMDGGGRDPETGPGAGLMTTMLIDDRKEGKPEHSIWLSLFSAGYLLKAPLFDGSGSLALSIRKSLYEITWVPLLVEINKKEKMIPLPGVGDAVQLGFGAFSGFGDVYARVTLAPAEGHDLAFELFNATGYTDFTWEIYNPTLIGFLDVGILKLSSQFGGGAAWRWSPLPETKFTAAVDDIFGWNRSGSSSSLLGGETDTENTDYPLNRLGLRLGMETRIAPDALAACGLSGAWYEGFFSRQIVTAAVNRSASSKSDFMTGPGLSALEASAWGKVLVTLGDVELEPALRLDWIPVAEDGILGKLFPSATLQAFWYPEKDHSFHAGGGLRSDRIDYPSRHAFLSNKSIEVFEKRDEDGKEQGGETIDDDYVQRRPLRFWTLEADYAWEPGDFRLRAGAFGGWADDLSGFNYQTYRAGTSFPGTTLDPSDRGMKDAREMWTAGCNLDAMIGSPEASLGLLWNFGKSMYLADSDENGTYEWILPKQTVENMFKVFGHLEPDRHWLFDATLKVLVGIAQTPHRVTDVSAYGSFTSISHEEVPGKAYQLVDRMPRLNLDLRAAFRWGDDVKWEIFLDLANLLSFPQYREPAVARVGFEETSALDRSYDWTPFRPEQLLYVKADFGVKVRF